MSGAAFASEYPADLRLTYAEGFRQIAMTLSSPRPYLRDLLIGKLHICRPLAALSYVHAFARAKLVSAVVPSPSLGEASPTPGALLGLKKLVARVVRAAHMQSRVFGAEHRLDIGRGIVADITVAVMRHLVRAQRSANRIGGYQSIFEDISVRSRVGMLWNRDQLVAARTVGNAAVPTRVSLPFVRMAGKIADRVAPLDPEKGRATRGKGSSTSAPARNYVGHSCSLSEVVDRAV